MDQLDSIASPDHYLVRTLRIASRHTTLPCPDHLEGLVDCYHHVQSNTPNYQDLLKGETTWALEQTNEGIGPDGDALKEALHDRGRIPSFFVPMVAQTAISGYNSLSKTRNRSTSHFTLYGNPGKYDHPFCKLMHDRLVTIEQMEDMKNGILEPVTAFVGGWCSRQSWMAIDVEWDPEAKERVVTQKYPVSVFLDPDQEMEMKVYCPPVEANKMQVQIAEESW